MKTVDTIFSISVLSSLIVMSLGVLTLLSASFLVKKAGPCLHLDCSASSRHDSEDRHLSTLSLLGYITHIRR